MLMRTPAGFIRVSSVLLIMPLVDVVSGHARTRKSLSAINCGFAASVLSHATPGGGVAGGLSVVPMTRIPIAAARTPMADPIAP